MPPVKMKDMIILLPGILGSVLRKDGRDLWAPSLSAVSRLTQRDALVNALRLQGDDPQGGDLGDGVVASAIMPDVHLIPGFWKIDGYSTALNFLADRFGLTVSTIDSRDPNANLFSFPYDWRRDNRASAHQLKAFIDGRLPQWRQASGAQDAKVILIGHSMGGLVSRYYLEVLGGWEQCRALFTFGTPHRGSVNALETLSNGCKVLWADVTPALRSFQSVYQLLPNYRMIVDGDGYLRVSEIDAIPGIDAACALQAQAFHDTIYEHARQRRADAKLRDAYTLFPVVGTRQPTLNSATISGGKVVVSPNLPDTLRTANVMDGGDGTVPFFSSIPREMAGEHRELFAAEVHGSLQSHPDVLEQLYQHLVRLQTPDWEAILGPDREPPPSPEPPAISLSVEDIYRADEPVTIRASVLDTPRPPAAVEARVTRLDAPDDSAVYALQPDGEQWSLALEGQQPGVYRVAVRIPTDDPAAPKPVHDLFEVAE